jgi:cellobiose transport system substrate-binding protein
MQYSDLLAPVPDDLKGRWLDWKEAAATDAASNLIGYGTDIGPQGVCYRSDLFAAAGLPTDRAEVAKLLDGDWDNYFDIGAQYTAATGGVLRLRQLGAPPGHDQPGRAAYEDPDGSIMTPTRRSRRSTRLSSRAGHPDLGHSASGPGLVGRCPTARSRRCSARDGCSVSSPATPRTSRAGTSLTSSPAAAATGAAYLTVPANGKNVAEARARCLADQPRDAAQGVRTREPSEPGRRDEVDDSLAQPTSSSTTPPPAQILTDRANAVTVSPFKGQFYFQINDAMQKALTRVFEGLEDEADEAGTTGSLKFRRFPDGGAGRQPAPSSFPSRELIRRAPP